ncbi:MAG: SH3 domain-containing protein [Anaerolineae bacterium]|nr:SH3 domain-containing protein [Anaerolineae bacterium]MCA9895796.1 SH3 domain-containing protein [Anaerolineae bacterium]MCB9461245.1 SH3 domain-containing protein [Anaerolineaceae bacterium]
MESAGLAAWTMLAPPLALASGSTISPADAAPGDGEVGSLTIGGGAVINTTDGDRLNMRSGPGVDFSRLARLADGAQVIVLEGPVAADGFVWWRVRTVDGTEGWVVQSADDVRTLIPSS